MICGQFHQGSGLGNQLHRYVATRCVAFDRGYNWAMTGIENFKGKDFMDIQMGNPSNLVTEASFLTPFYKTWDEKKVVENGIDIRGYDPEVNFIEDNTVIDGEFQDEKYFEHRLSEIKEWLKIEPLEVPDDLCIINLRGGEYTAYPDLFLKKEYWTEAIELMKEKCPGIRFEVHTDDKLLAEAFFLKEGFPVVDNKVIGHSLTTNMGLNWRALRYAKYAIISNSSFAIIPRLIRHLHDAYTIAPQYWARRNTKIWATPSNYYKQFKYI